jgi:predicted nucleic acid-binding Zn ribbon protein
VTAFRFWNRDLRPWSRTRAQQEIAVMFIGVGTLVLILVIVVLVLFMRGR